MGAVQPSNATKAGRSPEFAHRLQAWGAALCFGVFGSLPLNCASTLGGALARHIGPRLKISNQARRNLRCALPELSDDEIARVVAGMWDNLGRVVAEYRHLRKIDAFEPGGRVEIRGLEYIDRAVATGRRMIFFSGHLANWEIAALAAVRSPRNTSSGRRVIRGDGKTLRDPAVTDEVGTETVTIKMTH